MYKRNDDHGKGIEHKENTHNALLRIRVDIISTWNQ